MVVFVKLLKMMRAFDMDYSGIQPYIFTQEDHRSRELSTSENVVLASPFRRFSIELEAGNLTSDENGDVTTTCIYCEELGPNNYKFLLDSNAGEMTVFLVIDKHNLTAYKNGEAVLTKSSGDVYFQYLNLVNTYIEKIHSKKSGLINRSGKAKFKNKDGIKQTYVPRDVIYVSSSSKKSKSSTIASGVGRVRWLDGWAVSAHWRTIDENSLGKDRNGERTVKGKTFVGDYVKGAERTYFVPRKVVL